ncbi:DNA sulfur modification protein DndB [Tolypothrix sp. FACHB-123]|uniref:DNA sulfur modification protein DndB n=1 Tax=Tolypothrix sp. FACHB-123 TaxID=2692868 RepID=UPI001682EC29|nr:DNA sulfur modification protein DndB [Tolypothrix sp. FACHB-123]MBD2356269.1 DNA sulfur modification protein DndB [Tolypothrix sp. FACHB-123]
MAQIDKNNNNHVPPEVKAQFSTFLAPFFEEHYRDSCYPGLMFRQGKRKMLQINIPAKDFPALLVAKPAKDDDPELGKQRPEVPGHAEEIKNYIIEQARKGKPWILGTLTANVPADKITILELGRGICIVVIPRDVKLEITDGQHRKTAIQKLIESEESSLISDNDFPITLVLENDIDQCRKDFGDMAQTKPLGKALLLSFGEVEGRVGITKNLVKKVKIFYEKTDKIHDSPRIQKKFIYTNNYITRAVSCAFTKNPDSELHDYDVENSSNALANCLNKFFFECSNTRYISETNAVDLTTSELKKFKEECLLGVSVGLEVLGRLLYLTYDKNSNYFDEDKVSQLAQIDWTRENPLWQNNLIRIDPNPKNLAKRYKLSTGANAVTDAVKTVKDRLGWTDNSF